MCNPIFEMVKYHNKDYPENITLHYEELAAHFDVCAIAPELPQYSQHTEYSYGKRNFSSELMQQFPHIKQAQKKGVPQLWKSEQWAQEFAEFVFSVCAEKAAPSVIEIHPPFDDYTESVEQFVQRYMHFEKAVLNRFPNVQLMIENRSGSIYGRAKFVVTDVAGIIELSDAIDRYGLKLRIALDIPQLFTAHSPSGEEFLHLLAQLKPIRHNIAGVHLWGKRKSQTGRLVAHCGDLHSYFNDDEALLNDFLRSFNELFNDGISRKLVLEVNSGNDDMLSIINDLQNSGVVFA